MAGTRLCIQLTLFVQFLLLVGLAAYLGLCRNSDVLCTPLFKQEGRALLKTPHSQWKDVVFDIQETVHREGGMQQARKLKRYSMQITLVLEDASAWSVWSSELDKELLEKKYSDIPCLKGSVRTELLLDDTSLSQSARPVVNAENSTEYHVPDRTVQEWLESQRQRRVANDSSSLLQAFLYVPSKSKEPLLVSMKQGGKPATAITLDQRLLSIVDSSNDDPLHQAISFVDIYLQDKCQLPKASNPSLWWQQLVHDTHEEAKNKVLETRDVLLKSSLKVPVTNEVAQRWRRSTELVDAGLQLATDGDYPAALDYFDGSLAISTALATDPSLMEPLDLQNDHYLAIFAPLLFPLLLPFFAGLIREVKRYRKLTNK